MNRLTLLLTLVALACDGTRPVHVVDDDADDDPPPPLGFHFTSRAEYSADHNRPWKYVVTVAGAPEDTVFIAAEHPDWLSWDPAAGVLEGTADWANVGDHTIRLVATSGASSITQQFTLRVAVGEILCGSSFGDPAASAYALPYPVGRTYTVIQSYCPPNPLWGHTNWFAYDFDLAIGDTIVAARAGTVILTRDYFANSTRVCGDENFVYVQHADGTVAGYVHLTTNGVRVSVGQSVAQGELLGLSGDSGCSTGPHLHFHVLRDATNFNRQATLPVNFRNAVGPLDPVNGLLFGASYAATP